MYSEQEQNIARLFCSTQSLYEKWDTKIIHNYQIGRICKMLHIELLFVTSDHRTRNEIVKSLCT